MADTIPVQVCYALPDRQIVRDLFVTAGTSLQQAIEQSGILQALPEINLAHERVGIFGKTRSLDVILREHDRVEIYRPLIVDPKEARRRRAMKK